MRIRKRLNVLVISKDLGGKTNFRLQLPDVEKHLIINGEETVNRFVNEIRYLDFARIIDKVERVEEMPGGYRVITRGGKEHEHPQAAYETRAIIVATGTRGQVPGRARREQYLMRGLCFSAMSDAPLFIDSTPSSSATTIWRCGGAGIVAHRQDGDAGRAHARQAGQPDRPAAAQSGNVLILEGYAAKEVKGDAYARSLVVGKNGDVRELATDVIFVELGLKPNSDLLGELIELEADGRIKVDVQESRLAARHLCGRRCDQRLRRAGVDRGRRRGEGGADRLTIIC